MKTRALSLIAVLSLLASAVLQADTDDAQTTTEMTQPRIKQIISEIAEDVEGETNLLTFYYNGANLALISDVAANRMRIVAPVISTKDLSQAQMLASLVSNYHLALDARYAIGDGILYSAFIHPLRELTEDQLISAVRQVATLRNTFGTDYTSGEMLFGIEAEKSKEDEIDL